MNRVVGEVSKGVEEAVLVVKQCESCCKEEK